MRRTLPAMLLTAIILAGCSSTPDAGDPTMALDMKPICERCDASLPTDAEAYICSYECTFCATCTASMKHVCPNCGGELKTRPRREG